MSPIEGESERQNLHDCLHHEYERRSEIYPEQRLLHKRLRVVDRTIQGQLNCRHDNDQDNEHIESVVGYYVEY